MEQVSSAIYVIGAIFILVGLTLIISMESELMFWGTMIILEGILVPLFVCPLIMGQAELIEKTSSIEEILKNNIVHQEEILNKNIYCITQKLQAKTNLNENTESKININQKILETLESIDKKIKVSAKTKKTK